MGILDRIYASTQNHAANSVAPNATASTAPPQVATGPGPGIMKTIGALLAPEVGSFWQQATANGLSQAKAGQQLYQQQQAEAALKDKTGQLAYDQAAENLADDKLNIDNVGGALVRHTTGTDGNPVFAEAYRPTPQPTEQERLLERFMSEKDPGVKSLIERMFRGYQYSPDYIAADTTRKTTVKKTAAPRAAGGRGGGVTATSRAKYIAEAEAAIANGADPVAVQARLAKIGVK